MDRGAHRGLVGPKNRIDLSSSFIRVRHAVGEAVDIDVLKEVCRPLKQFNKYLILALIELSTKNKLPTSFTDKNETICSRGPELRLTALLSRDGVRTLIILCKVVLLKKHDGPNYSVIGNNQKTISCFFG